MLVLPWLETHSTVGTDLRAGSGPFPEPRALVLPSVDFGPSKPDGHSYMNAIDRDLMHHHFRPSPTSNAQKSFHSSEVFFKKPVFTSRTFLNSSLCAPAIPTLPT